MSLFLQRSHGWLWLRLFILDYAEYWSKYLYDSLFCNVRKKKKSARLHIAFSLQGDWDYKYGMQV